MGIPILYSALCKNKQKIFTQIAEVLSKRKETNKKVKDSKAERHKVQG